MDKINQILKETDGGLSVILHYYPQAKKCLDNKRAKFKIRNEKTASVSIYQEKEKWYLKDFGNGEKRMDVFALVMKNENLNFSESLKFISKQFCNADYIEKKKPAEMPVFKKVSKSKEDKVEFKDRLSDFELSIIGKKVTQEICDTYKLKAIKYFVRKDSEYEIYSTDKFPIFCFDFGDWKKIYQPLNRDKAYRFSYIGNKPKDFIFGLDQLKEISNKNEAIIENEADENDMQDSDLKPDIFICSGDRDALNVAATGRPVIWMNSETALLSKQQYYDLKSVSKQIYVIPDIDNTGKRQGDRLCLKYNDIKMVILPEELKNYKDFRGNTCKDVTDFLKHSYKIGVSFDKLVRNAVPFKFWKELYTKNGDFKGYFINTLSLLQLLRANGYYRMEDKSSEFGYFYIKINENIVHKIIPKSNKKGVGGIKTEIKDFINNHVKFENNELRNKLFRSKDTDEGIMSNLNFKKDLDFKSCEKDYMYIPFNNVAWKITAKNIEEYRIQEIDKYFWQDDILDNCKKVTISKKPIFEINYSEKYNNLLLSGDHNAIKNMRDIDKFTIKINDEDFIYMKFLKNASRMYWKKESEGKELTEDEKKEELLHLINKIYTLGYLSFKHKDPDKPWAVFVIDARETETNKSSGGTGKSLFLTSLNYLSKTFNITGRDPEKTKNRFIFDGIDEFTHMININDANKYFKFDFFFPFITDDLMVEAKNISSFTIPFSLSPKIAISSNFALRNIDLSTKRRLLYVSFSDYYHEKDDDGYYPETVSPAKEFGKNLFLDFTEEEWNKFYNFIALSIQVFLKFNSRIDPPMDNIVKKNLKAEVGESIFDWAEDFFSDKKYLDVEIEKNVVFESIKENVPYAKNLSAQRMKKKIKAYCKYKGWELNPKKMLTNNSQIIKQSVEYLFIKTKQKD